MSTVTEHCVTGDVADPAHDRCVGAVFESMYEDGVKCECACHTLPRCFTPYVSDHGTGVYDCELHEGHGGNFHMKGIGGGSILWSVAR